MNVLPFDRFLTLGTKVTWIIWSIAQRSNSNIGYLSSLSGGPFRMPMTRATRSPITTKAINKAISVTNEKSITRHFR